MTVGTSVRELAARVAAHRPDAQASVWAATALILAPGPAGPEILFIQRVERLGDRWSGHMALPGGKVDAVDRSPAAAAVRETYEEVGITLPAAVGRLDDQHGRARQARVGTWVFALDDRPEPVPDPREVAAALWLPVGRLLDPASQGRHQWGVVPFPAFVLEGYTIWGLTHRIVTHFLEVAGLLR